MRRRTKASTGTAALLAALALASPAQASTSADDQYGGVLGEQGGGPSATQGAGALPFTGADLVEILGLGSALTAAGVVIRRRAAAPDA